MEPPWNGHDFGNRLVICVSCCFMHNFFYVGWWSLSMFQNTHSFVDIDGAFVCLWILLYDWRCQLKSASIRSSSSNRTGIVQPFLTYTVMTHRLTINFPGLNASLMCPSAYLIVGCSSKVAPHLLLCFRRPYEMCCFIGRSILHRLYSIRNLQLWQVCLSFESLLLHSSHLTLSSQSCFSSPSSHRN